MITACVRFWILFLIFATVCPTLCWSQLTESVLHSFTGRGDGQQPYAGLVQGADGALYGTTFQGGSNNAGLVFKVNPDGSGYLILYHFGAAPGDGQYPGAPLIQALDGGLFGTTKFGGTSNLGSVFRLAPSPPLISVLGQLPDKSIRLSVSAASNFVFRIEASSDQKSWGTITNIMNTSGTFQLIDYGASNTPKRFYRAAWVP